MNNDAIDYFGYNNKLISFKTYFSLKARRKMFDLFMKDINPTSNTQILDIGATPDTKLADSNLFDKLYPYKENITICSIEDCSNIVQELGLKKFVYNESKKEFPFEDNEFDACFCSAVLEHVGAREYQELFINECLRVSKKVFLITPYRFFPLEMHTFIPFLHWLPQKIFRKIVRQIKGEFWANIDNLNLCGKKDIEKMNLTSKVEIKFVRTLFMKSNMIIEKDNLKG